MFLAHSAFFQMYTAYINNCDLAQHLVTYWSGNPIPPGVEARLCSLLHAPSSMPLSPSMSPAELPATWSGSFDMASSASLPTATSTASTTSSLAPALAPNLTPLLNSGKTPLPRAILSKQARKARQKYLRKCAADPRRSHISVESYLLLPVQRVPRYRLLLEALVKVTPASAPSLSSSRGVPPPTPGPPTPLPDQVLPTHTLSGKESLSPRSSLLSTLDAPWLMSAAALASVIDTLPDAEAPTPQCLDETTTVPAPRVSRLDEALVQVCALAHTINESKRAAEQARRLAEWQARIAGNFPSPLVQSHRRFIRDGVVMLHRIVRLSSESVWPRGEGVPVSVQTLKQTTVEQPVVLLLCNDLAVFLTGTAETLPLVRAAGEDAAAQSAVTEAVVASASSMNVNTDGSSATPKTPGSDSELVARPPPPDSAGPLLQHNVQFEVLAILRTGWSASADTMSSPSASTTAATVERVDKTTLKVMDHSKMFFLSAQSSGDADAWVAAFQQALD